MASLTTVEIRFDAESLDAIRALTAAIQQMTGEQVVASFSGEPEDDEDEAEKPPPPSVGATSWAT